MLRALSVLVVLLCGTLGFAGSAAAAPPPAGMLVQLAPPNACWSTTAGGGCSAFGGGLSMSGGKGIAVSGDGANVYAGGTNGGGVAFAIGAGGALTQVGGAAFADNSYATSGAGVFGAKRDTGADNGGVVALRRVAGGALAFVNEVLDSCTTGVLFCMTNNNGLYDVEDVAVSPDGTRVYAVAKLGGGGAVGGAVTVFSRNPTTQAIAQLQCRPRDVSTTGPCNTGEEPGLGGADAVAVSPDGRFVYVTGASDGSIVGFNVIQAGTDVGQLGSPVNCLWARATTSDCAQAPGMGWPEELAISPEGRDVYVASFTGGVTALRRDTLSGVLSFNFCLTQAGGGGCSADAAFLAGARDVAVSPDGRYVYVSGGGALDGFITAYARDAATGGLTRLGCVTNLAAVGCTTAAGLANAEKLAVTPDGGYLYLTSFQGGDGDGAVAAFQVEAAPACQGRSVGVSAGGSVTIPLTCTDRNGEPLTRAIASAPAKGTLGAIDQAAGTVTYSAAAGASGADAFAFVGSDGTNASAAATVAVAIAARPTAPPPPALPRSKIVGLRRSVRASRLRGFRGTATAGSGVKRVHVSLVRLSGGAKIASATCQALTRRGGLRSLRLSRRRCRLSGFLRARGTARWSFTLKRRLSPGTYVLTSRATARNGAVERVVFTRAGNRRTFTVRAG